MFELTITINENREVHLSEKKAGNTLENQTTRLRFQIPPVYAPYNKYLDVVTGDGVKTQTVVSLSQETEFIYEIPFEFTKSYNLLLQLIMKQEDRVFKSNVFCLTFGEGLNVTQYYATSYQDVLNRLMEQKADREELSSAISVMDQKLDSHIYYEHLQDEFSQMEQKADKSETALLTQQLSGQQEALLAFSGELSNKAELDQVYSKEEITGLLSEKVTKIENKGLSSEDFTLYYRNKLHNLNLMDLGNQTLLSLKSYVEYPKAYQVTVSDLEPGLLFLFIEGDSQSIRQIFFGAEETKIRILDKISGSWSPLEMKSRRVQGEEIQKLFDLPTAYELNEQLNQKVDKVTGKGLSEADYTSTEKTKLGGIASNAQVNVIETVKVNNVSLPIAAKSVNIDLSGKADLASVYNKTQLDTMLHLKSSIAPELITTSGSISDDYVYIILRETSEIFKHAATGPAIDLEAVMTGTLLSLLPTKHYRFEWILELNSGTSKPPTLNLLFDRNTGIPTISPTWLIPPVIDFPHTLNKFVFETFDGGYTWYGNQCYSVEVV